MPDLYFTCDWMIRPAVNYVRLAGVARELGCELAIRQAAAVTQDRYVLMRFALRAPGQAAYDEFVAKVGQAVGLENWQPADAAVFAQAQPMDVHLLDADFLARWIDAMHAYGLHNTALRQEKGET